MTGGSLEQAQRAACAEVGVVYRDVPVDGRWHRANVDGDPRGRGDASIKLFPDGNGGIVYNWKGDKRTFFVDDGRHISPAERNERERQAGEDIARRQGEATDRAIALLRESTPARPDHPYLVRKGVAPTPTIKELPAERATSILGYAPRSSGELLTGRLLVALVKVGDTVSTAELIDEHGRKSAIAGGSKAGGFWAAQRLPDGDRKGLRLLIAEGVATALSAAAASGCPAVASLSCGNLEPVARSMRERYPAAELVVLADLGNGQSHAERAARAVGALLAIPDFGADRPAGASDFNDMAALYGNDSVAKAIDGAQAPAEIQRDRDDGPRLNIVRADSIKPEPVSWIWIGWLARGKLHIVAGAAGTGKTTTALALAATITTGGRLPDNTLAPKGNVLVWSGEDDPKDTLVPRLAAMGADMGRVYFVADVTDAKGERAFDPATDVPLLEQRITEIGEVSLLIVDPIVNVVLGDSHKNTEVRRALAPLVTLGQRHGAAVLGITHFSKGTSGRDPTERVTGSLAFGALARVVIVTAKGTPTDDDKDPARVFLRSKSNIGPNDGGFQYRLEQVPVPGHPTLPASVVRWGAYLEQSAKDVLDAIEPGRNHEGGTATREATDFLRDLLADGPLTAKEVYAAASSAGHSSATIRRCKGELGIKSAKQEGTMRGAWKWSLPEDAHQTPKMLTPQSMSTFGKDEHLQAGDDLEVLL